jgi:hypothetical protein
MLVNLVVPKKVLQQRRLVGKRQRQQNKLGFKVLMSAKLRVHKLQKLLNLHVLKA